MISPIRRLLGLLTPFGRWIALSALLGVATIGSGIGLMATSAFLIAKAALHPSIADLQMAIVGVRFFGIARGVFRYLERLVSHQVTFQVLARLRVWFYEAIEPLAPARLMEHRSGDLLSRVVSDVETLQHFYVRAVAPPIVAVVVALAVGGFLYRFDPALTGTLWVFLVTAGVGVPFLTRLLSHKAGQHMVIERAALNTWLVDSIQGMAELLAFGQESRQFERIRSAHRRLRRAQMRMALVAALHNALGALLANLGMWAVLVATIPLVSQGRLDGVYLAMLTLAALVSFEAVLPLPLAAQHLESSLEAARRLFAIVDARPAMQDPPDPAPPPLDFSLSARGLGFRYAPDEPLVLEDVSFALPQGGRLAIVGPSGAGKSTLVNLLLRFWDYQEGQILLGGHELRRYRPEDVHRLISVVSQQTHWFNGTIRENLLLARPEASEEEMVQATRQAQIHDFIQSLPHGYDTRIGEQGMRLSAGQRQRLAIARALLKDAPILILDEATANLDAVTEREVLQALFPLMEGRTTLMITHRLVGLERMDEVMVLQGGRVVERGRHDELLRMNGLYRRMWDLQNQVLAWEKLGLPKSSPPCSLW